MTAICGGGASEPIDPNFAVVSVMTAAGVEGLLAVVGAEELAFLLAPIIAGVSYDLVTICNSDPPADPVLTADDIIAAANWTDPQAYAAAVLRIRQWFLSWYWYVVCKCSSATTPTIPTPSQPTGVNLNVGSGGAGPAQPCWSRQNTQTVAAVVSGPSSVNVSAGWLPTFNPVSGFTVNGSTLSVAYPIPTGLQRVHFHSVLSWSGSLSTTVSASMFFYKADKTSASTALQLFNASSNGNGVPIDITATISPDTAYWQLSLTNQSPNPTVSLELALDAFCSSAGATNQPCCPPDPALEARLNQILGLVTLIQRQIAPFAYVDGSSSTGLTGNGHISIQGVIGARVTLTTIPTNVGLESGDPAVVWDAGWINFGDASGSTERRIISASPFEVFPRQAGVFTRIGYSLSAGVVATITPLIREAS